MLPNITKIRHLINISFNMLFQNSDCDSETVD